MRMLVVIITLLAVTPATGQSHFSSPWAKDPPRTYPMGHNNTVDFLLCAGFHEGLASWHERAGDKKLAARHQQLATEFHMNIGVQSGMGNRQERAARTLAVGAAIREEMKTAINSQYWLDRYTKMFGELCTQLEPAVTEYRNQ